MPYIGRDLRTGAFRQLDDISSGFDGSDTTHTMQVNSTNVSVGDVNQILLSLGGVIQKPGTDFTVSGSTLTFTTAPAANTSFFAILLGSDNGGTVTPTDVSVTKAKLADEIDIFAGTSLSAADLGTGIHIKTADSGAGVNVGADNLVVEDSGDSGITILAGTGNHSRINFGDSGDNDIGMITYDHGANQMNFKTNAAFAMTIDSAGHITKPLQPAFLVNSSGVTNFPIGQWNTLTFDVERVDKNSDFASNTFTAPVTGTYLLTAWIYYQNMDSAAASIETWFYASNRTEGIMVNSPGQDLSADAAYQGYSGSTVMDMDANDTVYIRMYQDGGTAQMDLNTSSAFGGFLIG